MSRTERARSLARIDARATDWREAVGLVADLLVASGAAEDRYASDCVRVVEDHGSYLVAVPGVALVHASPESGVLRPGLAACRLETPVAFGHPDHDPVDLLIGWCAVDDDGHLRAAAAIARGVRDGLGERLRRAATAEAAAAELDALSGVV